MHYFPTIWITRVHIFLPIGLGFVALILLINLGIGWNPKHDLPSSELLVIALIIPVLIYLVYWFIFQARYNVLKSGGKMNLGLEYLNYFLYMLVFATAVLVVLIVPISNDIKVKLAVDRATVLQDIEALNKGNSLFYSGNIDVLQDGRYEVYSQDFIDNWDELGYYNNGEAEIYDRNEALSRIENFKVAFNRYSNVEIHSEANRILANALSEDGDINFLHNGNEWKITSKLLMLNRLHHGNRYSIWNEGEFWQIWIALICGLSLLVWIFKQMNVRQFVFGFISICLTPLVAGILALLIFSMYRSSSEDGANFSLILVFLAYIVVASLVLKGFGERKLNLSAYVMTMYLNFWVPLLPLFIYAFIWTNRSYGYWRYFNGERILGLEEGDFVYWSCITIAVLSIAIFKPLYTKFRSLPAKK